MILKIDIYNSGGTAVQDLASFGSRPLGGTSNPIEVQVWNDKSTAVSNEAAGTGDGVTAAFSLANGNLITGSPCVVKVAGVTKTETTHYSLDRVTGTVTFTPGNIPTAGQAVTASYHYGTGAETASNVYLLARRRQTFVASGASVALAATPSRIYEAQINSAVVDQDGYTLTDKVLTFDPAPTPGDSILVIYEDESCSLQMLQVKSSGLVDPFTVGISDDSQGSYLGIGGSAAVTDESVGVGDDSTVVFNLLFPCIVEGTLVVEVDDTPTEVTLDPVTGEIEFATAPADESVITASYRYYRVRQIGAINPGCARLVQLRGHAPTTATLAKGEAHLEVWAV
ncbi:MAG: hypothetical protein EOM93_06350 [Gammaproteobacteria bacterium]|nr:hypothetical protein [Gammaproteobacteria bacterium]